MDLHNWFWNEESNTVCTRYTSEFMGKAAAPDILKMFKSCMTGLNDEKMLQVFMDGPNVNRPFCLCSTKSVRLMNQVRSSTLALVICILSRDPYKWVPKPQIGTWRSYCLQCTKYFTKVHQEPVIMDKWLRQQDQISTTWFLFLLHENQSVVRKAREVWSKVVIVVEYGKSFPKSKQLGHGKPGRNTSFKHLSELTTEVLVPLKLKFFEEISGSLNAFLGM